MTSSVIDRSTIAPYFDVEDELDTHAIVAMGESAVPPLIELTNEGRDQEKSSAAYVLGYFSCREAVARLEGLLQDPDDGRRATAVLSFARSRGGAATPQLVRMLSDRDASVQRFVLRELERIGDTRALGPLATLRDTTPHAWVRGWADAAIAAINKRGGDAHP